MPKKLPVNLPWVQPETALAQWLPGLIVGGARVTPTAIAAATTMPMKRARITVATSCFAYSGIL